VVVAQWVGRLWQEELQGFCQIVVKKEKKRVPLF
jgi:hypothetical protein